MRLGNPRDRVDHTAALIVDDEHGFEVFRRDEQSMSPQVDGQVIEMALHFRRQRDRLRQFQRSLSSCRVLPGDQEYRKESCTKKQFHDLTNAPISAKSGENRTTARISLWI